MRPQLPEITHLQFLVMSVLRAGEQPGRVVRRALADHGARRTAAAFYQLMARLEEDRLVAGMYAPIVAGDQTVTERRYRMTAEGAKVWAAARAFYDSLAASALRRRWSDA